MTVPATYPHTNPLPTTGTLPVTVRKFTASLGPNAYDDAFPITWDVLLGGGYRAVGTTTERDAINADWRKEGMLVYVVANGKNYRLQSDLTTWTDEGVSTDVVKKSGDTSTGLQQFSAGIRIASGQTADWNNDLFLRRSAAANLALGAADAASPVAQTISVQNVAAGTTDTAGANTTWAASRGTGTGAGGAHLFQVAPAGTTGSSQNALVLQLAVRPAGGIQLGNGASGPYIFPISGATYTTPATAGQGLTIYSYLTGAANDVSLAITGNAFAGTSGAARNVWVVKSFTPTSGTGTYTHLELNPTINQTGGANGITRGLYINPTLTAAADFRSLDIAAGKVVIATSGALSAPAFSLTGTPITGGDATTTKPLVLIETTGATSAFWSTSGTMLGVNAPNAFAGNLIAAGTNGTSYFYVSSSGTVFCTYLDLNNANAAVRFLNDTLIVRDGAANIIALRNSTNAQAFRVYNTYTDASNNEFGGFFWSGNVLYIGSEKNGTGSTRAVIFRTGSASRWSIDTNGHFVASVDNTYDIGASGATRPRTIYAATNLVAGGSLTIGSSGDITIGSRFIIRSPSDGVIGFYNSGVTDFGRLQFGGTTTSFPSLKRSSAILQTRLADDSDYAAFEADTIRTAKARTVAQLPAAGSAGRRAYVTDANATTFMSVVAGGGANVVPVFDDGTNWVIA